MRAILASLHLEFSPSPSNFSPYGYYKLCTNMAKLPDDVLLQVFSYLPQESLAQCRFLSRSVEPLARALLFRYTRLEFGCDVDVFLNIVRSERLRPFVRELTVDLSSLTRTARTGTQYGIQFDQRRKTIMAIPLVRLFSGLRTLHLRFSELQSHARVARPWTVDNQPQSDARVARPWTADDEQRGEPDDLIPAAFSSIYAEKVLQCISGTWTQESQDEWEHLWRRWSEVREAALKTLMLEPGDPGLAEEPKSFGTNQQFPDTAINLTTLTISNLSEQDSEYLMSSTAMRRFLETQSLSTLQLLTTSGTDTHRTFSNESSILRNKYKFVQSLPSTWLSPPVADHLRTLSLFAHDYWGWCPKGDFRVLGTLPNLRTLALGMYVFSHQWQVDWVAQLGSNNGRGGLEELYLDNCPILWRGRVLGPLDSEGFPLEEVMTQQSFHPNQGERAIVDVSLRWSTVLDEWRKRMPALKTFKMGTGHWGGEFSLEVAMAQTASRVRLVRGAYEKAKLRTVDTTHLNYDKPPIEDCHKYGQDIIRDGTGLSQKRACLLQYLQFEIALGSRPWVERDFKDALVLEFEDGYQRYQEARRKDEDALDALNASIQSRSGSSRKG